MARGKTEEQIATAEQTEEQKLEQANATQSSNDETQETVPVEPVEIVLLKNIRHTTGVRRKGEKLAVSPEESQRLIGAKLARLPE